jgi:hypothetical protein
MVSFKFIAVIALIMTGIAFQTIPIPNTCSSLGDKQPGTASDCTSTKLTNNQVCCYIAVTYGGAKVSTCQTAAGADQKSIDQAKATIAAMGADATISCASTFFSVSAVFALIVSMILF